jgi:hypothetical protein
MADIMGDFFENGFFVYYFSAKSFLLNNFFITTLNEKLI